MKSWRLVLGFLGMGVVAAACSVKTTSTDDDTSTVGVGGSATATTTTSAGPTTTSAGPTSTASGVSCDTGVMAKSDSAECDACFKCALQGPCSTERGAYESDPDAPAWQECVFGVKDDAMKPGCPDDDAATMANEFQVCLDACDMATPGVEDKYLGLLSCAICGECPNNCDAASLCTS